ncbi:hypothetical protein Hdeb2414_s0001g00013211 [Helianthus debilis subsp. tardiflorus]
MSKFNPSKIVCFIYTCGFKTYTHGKITKRVCLIKHKDLQKICTQLLGCYPFVNRTQCADNDLCRHWRSLGDWNIVSVIHRNTQL